jgi:L-threonylcarbamoyladenylate synthase
MNANVQAAQDSSIAAAADILRRGGLVAFPTETVYGLGANALDGRAVARIFEAKGRPAFNPVIVHVADAVAAAALAVMDDRARALAAQFWPGPLTLVLPRRENCPVSELCSAGLPTLAVRVPAHPVALALLRKAEIPVAAPSANRSGFLSPTTPAHVAESLGAAADMILAGGACAVGLE